MLNKIKELADEAVKLQNKNRMDEVLREISAMCTQVKVEIKQVTYGTGKQFDSEAEMVADIQGVKSTIIKPQKNKQQKGKADE